ncbi:MAG: hypothetical protein QXJ20_03000, partial [Candidatus Aenigmatarchaeota archaeon]
LEGRFLTEEDVKELAEVIENSAGEYYFTKKVKKMNEVLDEIRRLYNIPEDSIFKFKFAFRGKRDKGTKGRWEVGEEYGGNIYKTRASGRRHLDVIVWEGSNKMIGMKLEKKESGIMKEEVIRIVEELLDISEGMLKFASIEEVEDLIRDYHIEKSDQVAIVWELPLCDICKAEDKVVIARFDARIAFSEGAWGYLCREHFENYSYGKLSFGYGQLLITKEEAEELADKYYFIRRKLSSLEKLAVVRRCKEKDKRSADDVWCVYSEKGRLLGRYRTKEEAEKRLRQVEYFKRKKKD